MLSGSSKVLAIFVLIMPFTISAQLSIDEKVMHGMLAATKYMADSVSYNGGYVWYYLPDLSRRWGELEAYPTMTWIQGDGTVAMGNTFIDACLATNDEYYYKLAEKAALSLIDAQLDCGGWNYMTDHRGDESIKKWYATVGKNAWALEEFQKYSGNATFDNETTTGAAEFLLRIYLLKKDYRFLKAVEKAGQFILKSQYEQGGWPQRYPAKNSSDYTACYTFNDRAIWNNIRLLIILYDIFDRDELSGPIKDGMDFYLLSQQPAPQDGWCGQYTMDMKPAGARTYEPAALYTEITAENIHLLLKFYYMTGCSKYLNRIHEATNWLESVTVESNSDKSSCKVPRYIETGTDKPLFLHRTGSNTYYGKYYTDYKPGNTPGHLNNFRTINLKMMREELRNTENTSRLDCLSDSLNLPITHEGSISISRLDELTNFLDSRRHISNIENNPDRKTVLSIIDKLDSKGRWLVANAEISNPYIGMPENGDINSTLYSATEVGDEYDTSRFEDNSGQVYISTAEYCRNMKILINYLKHSAK
jgi:PelA/Pel-15E family pectate lyase